MSKEEMMPHFLFITWHGGGNDPPAISIAQELKTRGHRVTFAGFGMLYQLGIVPPCSVSAAFEDE